MSFTKTKIATACALAMALTPTVLAEVVTGTVTDRTGEAPLEGAIVKVNSLGIDTTTDRFGNYRFANLPAGTYEITVSYIGADNLTQTVNVASANTVANFRLLSGDDDRIENVLVVGTRAAQAGSLNLQRASDAIISVIDSDGLGNFPDTTVADSLQRVPGLSIETDQGEGRYVSIRGINTDLIGTSINNVRTPSPEDRRGVLLDGVPSDLLETIEIQKSLTPDLDADSLGGFVNLKTISAFDREGRFMRAKLEGRRNDISKGVYPKGTFTYSETFNDNFGMALSANYQKIGIESHNNEAGEWGIDEDSGNYYLNDDYEQRWYDLTRERTGIVANFDWHATENTNFYLRTLYNRYEDDEVRNKFEYRDLDDAEGGVITANSSLVPINEIDAEVRQRNEIRKIQTVALGGTSNKDNWTFDYEVSYAYAEEDDSDNHDVTFRYEDIQDAGGPELTFSTANPEQPTIAGDLSMLLNPANYVLDELEQEFTVNEDTEKGARFDAAYDTMYGNTLVTWKGGLKYRTREKVRDANKNLYSGDLNLANFGSSSLIPDWRLSNPMPTFPSPTATANLRGGEGLDFETEASAFESLAEDFNIQEDILAVYGMGTADFGKLTLVGGVRVEMTDVDAQGNIFVEDAAADSVIVRNITDDYNNVLPSLNAKYELNDRVILRGAYYAAVVRPSFGDMAPFARFNDDQDEVELGNPDLEALEADNYDLAIEYYPTKLSVLSAGYFYKSIDNAIFPATYDIDDLPASVDLSFLPADQIAGISEVATAVNVGSVHISGVELNYVQELGFLGNTWDGFLVSANATFSDSEATLPDGREVPFLKQSDEVYNLALGYDKGAWDLRVSANFRGAYLDELVEENLDRYNDDRTLIEAVAKYKINDQWQVYVEGKNLTDQPEYYYFGDKSRLSQYDEFGRTFILGARWTY